MKLYCTMCPAGRIANYVYRGESLCAGHYFNLREEVREAQQFIIDRQESRLKYGLLSSEEIRKSLGG